MTGMQTVWVMGNEDEIMKVPYEHILGYLEYGGGVNGNDTHDPHVVHFKGGNSQITNTDLEFETTELIGHKEQNIQALQIYSLELDKQEDCTLV